MEKIVGHRGEKGLGGKIEYEVEWKNHSDAENTWEPLRTLKDCPESIQEYWEIQRRLQKYDHRPKRRKET